jgi:lactate dehydrogenase-like 2-hydroxyacid dehydrogenase
MIYCVNWAKPFPAPLNEGLLRPLVKTGLKFISVGGAGYDRVDIDYLTSQGVIYANNPRTVMHRTADSTAMMILMACKAATQQERNLREGKWADRNLKAKNPRGLTLGIVGMGNIGSIGKSSTPLFPRPLSLTNPCLPQLCSRGEHVPVWHEDTLYETHTTATNR